MWVPTSLNVNDLLLMWQPLLITDLSLWITSLNMSESRSLCESQLLFVNDLPLYDSRPWCEWTLLTYNPSLLEASVFEWPLLMWAKAPLYVTSLFMCITVSQKITGVITNGQLLFQTPRSNLSSCATCFDTEWTESDTPFLLQTGSITQ
jgi:hypothetical protein